jgi:hypothetical protein
MCFTLTPIIGIDPCFEFRGTQQAVWFRDSPLAMDPFRFNRVQPRTFARQRADDDPHTLSTALDLPEAMSITPYTNAQLDPTGTLGLTNPGWGGQAPLWFGILKESELAENGARLGPTGRQIVAEVIVGILDADKDSYFHSPPAWSPAGGSFGIADLLLFAGAVP